MKNKKLNFSGSKKLGGKHGEIVKKEEKIVKMLGREVCVVVYQYKSGLTKSTSYFADSDLPTLKKRNTTLLKENFELKEKLRKLGEKK